MLVIRLGALYVYREKDGLRVTIPTVHSSALLTQKEAHALTAALVKLFRTPKTKGGGDR
jgi:hypothetical protein